MRGKHDTRNAANSKLAEHSVQDSLKTRNTFFMVLMSTSAPENDAQRGKRKRPGKKASSTTTIFLRSRPRHGNWQDAGIGRTAI